MTLELNAYGFPTLHFVVILLSSKGWLVISPAAQNELKKHHMLSADKSFSAWSAEEFVLCMTLCNLLNKGQTPLSHF